MHENLAPSYKQIAIAILKNDHALQSLGFSVEPSAWYIAIKREEIRLRPQKQLRLFP
jgi:predicted phosphoadenosine phosphosulfate sulfurtransferase